MQYGTKVIFTDPHTKQERNGYFSPYGHSDWIVSLNEEGKGDYPHYRADAIEWRVA